MIVEVLLRHGIDTVFGISGGFILPLFQATAGTSCEIVATRNEQGASFMADAYARARGHAGCCVATSGPGATNLLTGVAGAYADSVPLIVITGQVSVQEFGHGGIQEGSGFQRSPSVQDIFRPIVKASVRACIEDDLEQLIEGALRCAHGGRPGPVHVEIPIDVLTAEFRKNGQKIASFPAESALIYTESDSKIEHVVERLKTAKAPVLLAGAGAIRCEAFHLVRALQEKMQIPVATSLGGKGVVDESHPLSLGMIGCYGQDFANQYLIEQADLIIALGISFQYLTSISWHEIFHKKPLIHVDIDQRELGKNFQPAIRWHGSATWFLKALLHEVKDLPLRFETERLQEMKRSLGFYPAHRVFSFGGQSESYLNPCAIGQELSKVLTEDDSIVIDSGENAYWSMYSIQVRSPAQFFVNAGWGSMGYGVAAPVGVASARKGKGRVFATMGDGGFLMNATELLTGVQIEAPITWIVMDNRGYGTQKHWQRDWFNGVYIGTEVPPTDFSLFAKSMGVAAFEARNPAAFRDALQASRAVRGGALIWAHIDPQVKPPQAFGSRLKK